MIEVEKAWRWRDGGVIDGEIAKITSSVFAPGFFVIHDTGGSGEDNETELTRWKEVLHPLLVILYLHVETRRDHTALVEASQQVDDDLATSAIINQFELTNVSCNANSFVFSRQLHGARLHSNKRLVMM